MRPDRHTSVGTVRSIDGGSSGTFDVRKISPHVFQPFDAVGASFSKNLDKLRIIFATTTLHGVLDILINGILNAFLSLLRSTDSVVTAGSKHGIAACKRVFLKQNHLGSGALCCNCRI